MNFFAPFVYFVDNRFSGSNMPTNPLIACHDCDLVQYEVPLPAGESANCARCGALLYRSSRHGKTHTLALCFGAAILFAIANLYPIIGIESQGNRHASTLFGAVQTLWREDMELMAGLVFFTILLVPALELTLLIWLHLSKRLGSGLAPLALRLIVAMQPWRMVEVFMLGLLVSVVKLSHLAHIVPGVALWCFAALLPLFALLNSTFNPRELWAAMPLKN
jgi:paraquat-inducible protein A